jgi:PAS domain S-box-containing protein
MEQISNIGGWSYDVKNQNLYWTDKTRELHGAHPKEKISLEKAISFYLPTDRVKIQRHFDNCLQRHLPYDIECKIQKTSGQVISVRTSGNCLLDANGTPIYLYGTFQDITELVRRAESEKLLYQELDHRVRNNFQIILSLLDLTGARESLTPESRQIIKEIENRIFTMANLHQILHKQKAPTNTVPIGNYLRQIKSHIQHQNMLPQSPEKLKVQEIYCADLSMDTKTTNYLGLAFVELIMNSEKHFAPDTPNRTAYWLLKQHDRNTFHLLYFDGGTFLNQGLPEKVNITQAQHGLKLLDILAESLSGSAQNVAFEELPSEDQHTIRKTVKKKALPKRLFLFIFKAKLSS